MHSKRELIFAGHDAKVEEEDVRRQVRDALQKVGVTSRN